MARMRTIKPEFFEDTKLAKVSVHARYMYAGLWCWADRQGIFELDSMLIKKNIFPYDNAITEAAVDALVADLVRTGIILVAHFEGKGYGLIPKFLKHQNPHHKEHIKYRVPLENFENPEQAQGKPGANPEDLGFMDLGFMDLGITPTVEQSSPVVVEFKFGTVDELMSSLPPERLDAWLGLYLEMDFIEREIRKAFMYYTDNPKKKPKAKRGWLTALNSWLERAWDWRAKKTPGNQNQGTVLKNSHLADWVKEEEPA